MKFQLTIAWDSSMQLLTCRCAQNFKLAHSVDKSAIQGGFWKDVSQKCYVLIHTCHTKPFWEAPLCCWDSAHGETREKLAPKTDWRCTVEIKISRCVYPHNYCILFRPLLCSLWHMHTYSLEALCPLSVPHPSPLTLPVVLSPRWRCVLFLQWPSPESRAGWRGSWRESGASSLKTMWRCCSPQMEIFMDILSPPPGKVSRNAREIHSRASFIQTPQFCQAGDCVLTGRLFLIHKCTHFGHKVDLVMHVQACCFVRFYLLWCSIHMNSSSYYKMGLHLQRSAVYEDAVTSKHPGNFVAAAESVRVFV